jgi:hypothetical protein
MNAKLFLAIGLVLFANISKAQHIPIEVFGGDKRATIDVLFAKYVKNKKNEKSNSFFFSRSRATVDYKMTTTTNLPQFAFTEAISYDFKGLHGFAPVAVVQLFNRGVYPRAGIRYLKLKTNFTFFGWTVIDVLKNPTVDVFILTRYTPRLSEKLKLYSQVELINDFPTQSTTSMNFTQRLRFGLQTGLVSFGAATDLNETGRERFTTITNTGFFLRYEF